MDRDKNILISYLINEEVIGDYSQNTLKRKPLTKFV